MLWPRASGAGRNVGYRRNFTILSRAEGTASSVRLTPLVPFVFSCWVGRILMITAVAIEEATKRTRSFSHGVVTLFGTHTIALTRASIGRGPFTNGVVTPTGMERPRVPPPGGPSESPRRAPGGQTQKFLLKKDFRRKSAKFLRFIAATLASTGRGSFS